MRKNSKSVPITIAVLIGMAALPTAAQCADQSNVGESNKAIGKMMDQILLPSFSEEQKKKLEKAVRDSLDIRTLINQGDTAFSAEDYCKSANFYRRAFYAGKLLGEYDHKLGKTLDSLLTIDFRLKLAKSEMLMASYTQALENLEELRKDLPGNELNSVKTLNAIAEIHYTNGRFEDAQESLNLSTKIAVDNKLSDASVVETKLLAAIIELAADSPLGGIKRFTEIASEAEPFGKPGKQVQVRAALEQAKLYESRYLLSKAKERAQFALELSTKAFGSNSLEAADCMTFLGLLLPPLEGKTLISKAASIQALHLETMSHPAVANTILALSENKSFNCRETELLCTSALASIDGVISDESPLRQHGLRLLAYAQLNADKNLQALNTSKLNLQITEKLYSTESLKYARALIDRAVCLEKSNFYTSSTARIEGAKDDTETEAAQSEGVQLADQAYELIQKLTGAESLNSASCLSTKSWMLLLAKERTDAKEAAKQALRICDKSPDAAGASTVRGRVTAVIRHIAIEDKDWKLAQEGLASSMLGTIEQFGICSKNFFDILKDSNKIQESLSIAKDEGEEEEVEEAEDGSRRTIIKESLSLLILQTLPTEETGLAGSMSMLANYYGGFGKGEPAAKREASLKSLLKGEQKVYGPDSPRLTRQLVDLGSFYQSQKKFAMSEEYFAKAEMNIQLGLGADHPELLLVLPKYAAMLREKGDQKGADSKELLADSIRTKYEIPKPKPRIIPE